MAAKRGGEKDGGLQQPTRNDDEKRMMRIYYDIGRVELRASDEAMEMAKTGGKLDLTKYGRLYEELEQRYKLEVAETYGLSQDEMEQITAEGDTKMWPLP